MLFLRTVINWNMFFLAKSIVFPLGEWEILNTSDNPIAGGKISVCPVTDWAISDVFLTKLMEKASWATLAVR